MHADLCTTEKAEGIHPSTLGEGVNVESKPHFENMYSLTCGCLSAYAMVEQKGFNCNAPFQ